MRVSALSWIPKQGISRCFTLPLAPFPLSVGGVTWEYRPPAQVWAAVLTGAVGQSLRRQPRIVGIQNMANQNIRNWNERLNRIFGECGKPVWIAGPCAAENVEMMEQTVASLVKSGVFVIRAGAYKPRTYFGDFQGLGREALEIFRGLRRRYPVRIVSEVVDVRHIEAMSDCVDVLQVGARNMYNYELLKELGRGHHPVLLKNGLSATMEEFLKAAEYITRGGNDRLALCERGTRGFDPYTRNDLNLARVAGIKRETDFPVIVDISHSLGRKDIALPMARASLSAGADGVMVEVHPTPERALSDARQQLSLREFEELLAAVSQSA